VRGINDGKYLYLFSSMRSWSFSFSLMKVGQFLSAALCFHFFTCAVGAFEVLCVGSYACCGSMLSITSCTSVRVSFAFRDIVSKVLTF
jgi:hypothetical protein